MSDSKSEIVVYSGPDQRALAARGEPVTARNAPAIVKVAGRSAEFAWEEFFQVEIAARSLARSRWRWSGGARPTRAFGLRPNDEPAGS